MSLVGSPGGQGAFLRSLLVTPGVFPVLLLGLLWGMRREVCGLGVIQHDHISSLCSCSLANPPRPVNAWSGEIWEA